MFSKLDSRDYYSKKNSVDENQNTFLGNLLTSTDKISGSARYFPIPGISINGKGTGYITGEMTKFDFFYLNL